MKEKIHVKDYINIVYHYKEYCVEIRLDFYDFDTVTFTVFRYLADQEQLINTKLLFYDAILKEEMRDLKVILEKLKAGDVTSYVFS